MGVNRTSLSAGVIIGKILAEDPEISSKVTKVFPVGVNEATLPYVIYRCCKAEVMPVKSPGAPDNTNIEVMCLAESYGESVELAEAVRAALDFRKGEHNGLKMRKCSFVDREETYDSNAFIQALLFSVQIY